MGIQDDCSGFEENVYVCIGVSSGTPTEPGNGVATPTPSHPGMVDNCETFTFSHEGDSCEALAFLNGVPLDNFKEWNGLGPNCEGLQWNVHVCISVLPLPTPTPAHPGMVSNCDTFTFSHEGDSCEALAFFNGVSLDNFKKWNGLGPNCEGLQWNVHVCVGVAPTPTPTPTHPGMVGNCGKFTFVHEGDSCDALAFFNGISVEDLKRLNTGIGNDCSGLQENVYICIGEL